MPAGGCDHWQHLQVAPCMAGQQHYSMQMVHKCITAVQYAMDHRCTAAALQMPWSMGSAKHLMSQECRFVIQAGVYAGCSISYGSCVMYVLPQVFIQEATTITCTTAPPCRPLTGLQWMVLCLQGLHHPDTVLAGPLKRRHPWRLQPIQLAAHTARQQLLRPRRLQLIMCTHHGSQHCGV